MASALPLQGIRVINFGWVWAGPVAGQTIGFLGAEVFKIESRARIDMTRNLPPFAEGVPGPDRSLSNHACWAGNGSVSLNLKHPEARRLALELIGTSDVVIENLSHVQSMRHLREKAYFGLQCEPRAQQNPSPMVSESAEGESRQGRPDH